MKKYLFLIATIFSIFFITDKVNALSFTVNNEEVQVTDSNFVYYFYTQYKETFDNYKYFLVYKTSSGEYRIYFHNSDNLDIRNNIIYNLNFEDRYTCSFNSDFTLKNCKVHSSSSSWTIANISNVFCNFNIIDNTATILYSSNITKQDLIDYTKIKTIYTITYYINDEVYKTIETEEGSSHELLIYDFNKNTHNFSGWQYDETIDFTNIASNIEIKASLIEKELIPVYIEFPINKIEFYTLLVEVGVLIMIIFLKWCFPFKGGSDLK